MKLCRLIFRKDIGNMLLRVVYSDNINIPTVEQEIATFSVLNGYNTEALMIFDIEETDLEFVNTIKADAIRLVDGEFEYIFSPIVPEPPQEIDPVLQMNEKLDIIIQMQLEKEGII